MNNLIKKGIMFSSAKYQKWFDEKTKDIEYEDKGIFNSEMLMVIAIAKQLNIKEIWESGKARGQSTHILAECLSDSNIHSVEILKDTDDDIVAKKRLENYRNVELIYGNSSIILPEKIKDKKDVLVIIDGPKGVAAINLAKKMLENKKVKAVFLHDYHKGSPLREVVENTFKDHTFFTDDEEYVQAFKFLDDKCWVEHAKIGRYPYRRGAIAMPSYSSTLAVIFNNEDDVKRLYE